MNRQWSPSAVSGSPKSGSSKSVAGSAVKASVEAKLNADQTHSTRFETSYGHTAANLPPHHADAYRHLVAGGKSSGAAAVNGISTQTPYTGFDSAVALAEDTSSPVLSAATRLKLGLVGSGSSVHISDASGLHGGKLTGAGVTSWYDLIANVFNPNRRGPIAKYDDDDATQRHYAKNSIVGASDADDSDDESMAEGDWSEFDMAASRGIQEDVLVCGELSMNNFNIQNVNADGQTEATVQSVEDLVRLLSIMGREGPIPKKLRHLAFSGAEMPLWVLTLLFGARSDVPVSSKGTNGNQEERESAKPVAGSAVAAASAILSFRVPQKDVSTVSESENARQLMAETISKNLQNAVRDQLISLDLSGGALEPRFTPLQTAPAATGSHFKLNQDQYDPNAPKSKGKSKDAEAEVGEDSPEAEAQAAAFATEATTVTAAVLLLRDALQPTKACVPKDLEHIAIRVREMERALLGRLARAKREQRYADRKVAREGEDMGEEEKPLRVAEDDLELLDDEVELFGAEGEGEGLAIPTDEEYEEALEQLKRELHAWMDVPPVLPHLQALSLNDNPSLFLDPVAVAAEGPGSVESVTEPNITALEALRSLLQQSGLDERYAANYSKFMEEVEKMHSQSKESDSPTTLPVKTKYLTNCLMTLLLSNCGLNNSTALRHVAEGLAVNTSLKKLSLADNGFGQDDDREAFQTFADAIGGHKTLESLDISNNRISAEMCRLLTEAIETSFESDKKDTDENDAAADEATDEDEDPDKEPAFDELFDDVVPPEEEAPNVTVGLPPAEPGDEGDEVVDEPPEVDETADDEEGENEEDEEEVATGRPPKPRKASTEGGVEENEEEEEEDPDSDEAVARREQERRAAEKAWRASQFEYIWTPERILLEFSETTARREVCMAYVKELLGLKKLEFRDVHSVNRITKARKEKEFSRHKTGWSHLQILSLASNPIGDEGAAAVASMLRHTVSLSEDDQARAHEDRERLVAKLTRRLIREKRAENKRKRREEKEQAADDALRRRAEAVDGSPVEGLETARGDATRPVIPKLAVPRKNGDEEEEEEEEEDAENEDDNDAEQQNDEVEEEEEVAVTAEDIHLPHLPTLKDERPGLRSLYHLNISECKIGSKGLKALAGTLGENCKSLQTLNISRNRFATRPKKISADEGESESEAPSVREDDVDWVSPGIMAFGKALTLNTTLVTLDLSFNKLYPNSIFILAEAFNANRTLKHLNLRGNYIGLPSLSQESNNAPQEDGDAPQAQSSAFAQLLNAFVDETNGPCSLETLILDQNHLGATQTFAAFGETSATLLATLCHTTLDTLSLAGNDLTNSDMAAFSNALYAMAMDKKTGTNLDGSVSGLGMGGRRSSITDVDEAVGEDAFVQDEEEDTEHRMLGNQKGFGGGAGGKFVKAGTSFCVNTSATLRVFVVNDNPRLKGDVAGTAIARVLQFCSRLHYLAINGCTGLGDEGFGLLCMKVGSHPQLTIFTGSRIGITSLSPLTSALQCGNAPITAIDFGDNDISTESLQHFCSSICALATEALIGASPKVSPAVASTPLSEERIPSPPAIHVSDDDEEDCPPPPFDPNEEDITPAQSMQRQASRMAILAASTSRSTSPTAVRKVKPKPLLRYVSLWGRRGLVSVLPALEPLAMNSILEDFFCAHARDAQSTAHAKGPSSPLYDPFLSKDPAQGTAVYGQTPSAACYLHRSVFEGAYAAALSLVEKALANAKEQEAPPAQIEKLTSDVAALKDEILTMQRRFGLAACQGNESSKAPIVTSTPLVNTIRHQVATALVHELRLIKKRETSFFYPTDVIPSLEEDDASRLTIDSLCEGVRTQYRSEAQLETLQKRLEQLREIHALRLSEEGATADEEEEQPVHSDNAEEEVNPEVAGDDGALSAETYSKLIRQAERTIASLSKAMTKSVSTPASSPLDTTVTSPLKRQSREEAIEDASKDRALTTGSLLILLARFEDAVTASSTHNAEATDDSLRRMRWQCLANRLAMK